jgi:hypothetical protein
MKKIAHQPTASISTPPTNGPADRARLAQAAQIPTARARSAPGWLWVSSVSEHGISTAAPIPCATRAAISRPRLGASPQAAEARVNIAKPPTNTRLAPIRSPHAPAERISDASASV